MRDENTSYAWSTDFWLKKIGWLLGLLLTGFLIWYLWQWTATDTSSGDNSKVTIVDTEGDGEADTSDSDDDGDGYSDATEIAEGSDPLDSTSVPNATDTDGDGFSDDAEVTAGSDVNDKNSTPDNIAKVDYPYSYTDTDGVEVKPTVSASGCVYTYKVNATTTVQLADGCADLDTTPRDDSWTMTANADGSFAFGDNTIDSWCVKGSAVQNGGAVDTTCNTENGVLEIFMYEPSVDWNASESTVVRLMINDTDPATDDTNAHTILKPIVENFKKTN